MKLPDFRCVRPKGKDMCGAPAHVVPVVEWGDGEVTVRACPSILVCQDCADKLTVDDLLHPAQYEGFMCHVFDRRGVARPTMEAFFTHLRLVFYEDTTEEGRMFSEAIALSFLEEIGEEALLELIREKLAEEDGGMVN